MLSALLAGRITRRFGLGPTMVGASILAGAPNLLLPFASGPTTVVVPLVLTVQLLFSIAALIYQINAASLQQSVTPNALLGRVSATMFFLSSCTIPLGSITGGLLGELIGVRATIAIAATGLLLAAALIIFSPVRVLRVQPRLPDERPQPPGELQPA